MALLTIGALLTWWYSLHANPADPEQLLKAARLELARGHFDEAERLAQNASRLPGASPWSLLVAAEAAVKSARKHDALRHYEQVAAQSGAAAVAAQYGRGEILFHLGRLTESERQLREALALDDQHLLSRDRLALLLNISGRRWEAAPHLLHLVRRQPGEIDPLLQLGNTERLVEAKSFLVQCRGSAPEDPLPMLGQARVALGSKRLAEARSLLAGVQGRLPAEPEVQVRWGQILLDAGTADEFIDWNNKLPDVVERHPETWVLRGVFAMRREERRVAVRCFWEALRRDSEHRTAHYRLGQSLSELGEHELADPFLKRAERMEQLMVVLDDLFHGQTDTMLMQRAAQLTEHLGRIPEAFGWALAALQRTPDVAWARDVVRRLAPLRPEQLPRTRSADKLAGQVDLSLYPLPDWSSNSDRASPKSDIASLVIPTVRFSNEAESLGIEFRYFNSADPTTPGARIFETTGGGVGVIDYDADGWSDLYFTQGGIRPASSGALAYRDQFFRNESGHRFQNVSDVARLGDPDYSQGVAVGDYDNDGFPDLYVANLGQNRLYHNRGDGTFADVTHLASVDANQWTTSCLIADLNGDGHPDLYDVNYCAGSEIESLVCERDGRMRACSPRAFAPAPDHVWLNLGDGRFRNVSDTCGVDVPNGYGLGVLAADFFGDGRLSLFVANDAVPNFFFVNETARGGPLRFQDKALHAGVAVDAEGFSQACMGVAAGDADGDGLLDLFVTNFYLESNTLYRQFAPGQFVDDTRRTGLRVPSIEMLGFGTQFLDADLDGRLDLVVANGYVDDLRDVGLPYEMRPQYFRKLGGGRFVEPPADQLGDYFQGKFLGRGLARLDWNRDGLEDFAVSHIDAPVALVTNKTQEAGTFIALQFRATQSARDAIGTVVHLQADGRAWYAQLTAGDGYHASNHRQVVMGIGSCRRVDELRVRWPSGVEQTFRDLDVNRELLLIEGSDTPVNLPRN